VTRDVPDPRRPPGNCNFSEKFRPGMTQRDPGAHFHS
jgi:hypothetical protein